MTLNRFDDKFDDQRRSDLDAFYDSLSDKDAYLLRFGPQRSSRWPHGSHESERELMSNRSLYVHLKNELDRIERGDDLLDIQKKQNDLLDTIRAQYISSRSNIYNSDDDY